MGIVEGHRLRTRVCCKTPLEAAALLANKGDWDGGAVVWGELLFVPRRGSVMEDDGFLLATAHDAETSTFDAHDIRRQRSGPGPHPRNLLGRIVGMECACYLCAWELKRLIYSSICRMEYRVHMEVTVAEFMDRSVYSCVGMECAIYLCAWDLRRLIYKFVGWSTEYGS